MNKFDQLKAGELKEATFSKDEFLLIREELTKRDDFKQLIGTAQHNGNIVFVWSEQPRT